LDKSINISVLIGSRIKKNRKEKKMTIKELSSAINKSVSTVSKYERGAISIDVETLKDIAVALDTEISRLIDFPIKTSTIKQIPGNPLGTNTLYVYQYDGRIKKLVRSLLQLCEDDTKNEIVVTFYLNIPSFKEPNQCKYVYKGNMYCYDTIIHFLLSNPYNSSGRVTITTANPYWIEHRDSATRDFWGILSGTSFNPFGPFATKVLISKNVLDENSDLKDRLLLSKEDFHKIKQYNLLIADM